MANYEHKVSKIGSLDQLVTEFRNIFESDDIDVDHVQEVMAAYTSSPKDWRKYAMFDRHR